MKKKVLLLSVFAFFILGSAVAFAKNKFILSENKREMIVGTVQKKGLNSLEILDEQDKRVKRFVYLLDDAKQFHKGERVRVYYRPQDRLIEIIEKMTPLPYKKEGQNLGNIFKKGS